MKEGNFDIIYICKHEYLYVMTSLGGLYSFTVSKPKDWQSQSNHTSLLEVLSTDLCNVEWVNVISCFVI